MSNEKEVVLVVVVVVVSVAVAVVAVFEAVLVSFFAISSFIVSRTSSRSRSRSRRGLFLLFILVMYEFLRRVFSIDDAKS